MDQFHIASEQEKWKPLFDVVKVLIQLAACQVASSLSAGW